MYNVLQVHRSSVTQYLLQIDRMCSAEAAITINQNKQKIDRGTFIQWKDDRTLSYNGAKTVNRKHSFKSSAINAWRAKGSKKKRSCIRADGEMRKKWTHEIIN